MKITRQTSFVPRQSLGFRIIPFQPISSNLSTAATGGDMINFSYSHGKPSTSVDVMTPISRTFELPKGTEMHSITAIGTVDDAVSLSVDGRSRSSSSGAAHPFNLSIDGLAGGLHSLSLIHTNINYYPDPYGNISMISGSVGPCPAVTIIPDNNTNVICRCGVCTSAIDGDAGGLPPASISAFDLNSSLRLSASLSSSSGGSKSVREAELQYMRWATTFGSFRGLGSIPQGQLEILSYDYTDSLLNPSDLSYRHPAATALIIPEGGLAPNELLTVLEGNAYTNYICDANGMMAFPVGSTSSNTAQVAFVSALSHEESVIVPLDQATYVRISKTDGSSTFYHPSSGLFAAHISSQNFLLTEEAAERYLAILREEDGSIRQIWNLWDGLADITVLEQGYVISLYLPCQVTGSNPKTQLYTFEGLPFKTFTVSGNATEKKLSLSERDMNLPISVAPFVTTWIEETSAWSMTQGTGEDAIVNTRIKIDLEIEGTYQLITTISKGDEVASVVAENYLSHATGELMLSRTEGYGSAEAQTSCFTYDDSGRLISTIAPDGGETHFTYDAHNRLTIITTPWAGGRSQLVQTSYLADGYSYSDEPAQVDTNYVDASGVPQLHCREVYTYSIKDKIKRIEKRSTANNITRLEVKEIWQGNVETPFAKGRLRMKQAINGVQTFYDYAASSEHGALYTETTETRVAGVAIAAHSERHISYISAEGNIVREEAWILDSAGIWKRLSSTDSEFDEQNRLVKRTRSNGRSTMRSLMCTGDLLREIDENGVLTSYSYDTARQLIETIRAATPSTPETIVSYIRDAMNRVKEVRTDIGAMVSTRKTSYDLLGRTSSQTDELGRITTYAYSLDGLSTTVTPPSGATLITTNNSDGSAAHEYGTGQRELYHSYDYSGGRLRETTKLADQTSILKQTLKNGFDETVVVTSPTTVGFLYERSSYNEKGQIIQIIIDTGSASGSISMSPLLYEYDLFGNMTKETWKHNTSPTTSNSRISTYAYAVSTREEGIYNITTVTKNNAAGNTYTESSARLLSESSILESKQEETDARGNVSSEWIEYEEGTIRIQKTSVPSSAITASTMLVDNFITTQTDTFRITSNHTRLYMAEGMKITRCDGRGNTSLSLTDLIGRTLSLTDATGKITSTEYSPCCDQPAIITDALGHTSCYDYDIRGRKTSEWGTGIQPSIFSYDTADRLISLSSYRVDEGDITTNPADRSDGDTTRWEYHDATGLEIHKIYADGSISRKEYNKLALLEYEYNARGDRASYSYNMNTGTVKNIQYTDGSTTQHFTYNHLARIMQIIDASGTHSYNYNEYDELISENLSGEGINHLVLDQIDSLGRSSGYTYTKGNSLQQTLLFSYGIDGRMNTVGFLHGGIEQRFTYAYLEGSRLLHTLAHPNNILITQTYEEKRDLPISMDATRGSTNVVLRSYSYDEIGRPITRSCSRQAHTQNDSFGYNMRSELTTAQLGANHYNYGYDNIGNRKSALELAEESTYDANQLNQYSSIMQGEPPFSPSYDADGNQTLVKTSTGIWTLVYNSAQRPISFTSEDGATIIECGYDYLGRRFMKKVRQSGTITLHQRYIYRGYLQIACCDLTRSSHPALWLITWDPTESTATRALAIQKNATWYSYAHDITKNVTELYKADGTIATAYDYTPYGAVTAAGTEQPIQWSSEFYDPELALVYYNYRHYNPKDGRWINRDPIHEQGGKNLYLFIKNSPFITNDYLGQKENDKNNCECEELMTIQNVKKCVMIGVYHVKESFKLPWTYRTTSTPIPANGKVPIEKEPANIQIKGNWKTDEHCSKVAQCYEKNNKEMIRVIIYGIHLDRKNKEFLDLIFNGFLMGLSEYPCASGLFQNRNPHSYTTGTLNAATGHTRQIGVKVNVSIGKESIINQRINFSNEP